SNYTYLSIYNSSNVDKSFLALFNWETPDKRKYERNFDESEIFDNNNSSYLSWGTQDKIYRATDGEFEIVDFNNKTDEISHFHDCRRVKLESWGEVIYGGTSYFGTIIEYENALTVELSDNTDYTIEEPISRWRVYPRSKNYENHLHVIKDGCIEIYSFNSDYFIDQDNKDFGIKYVNETKQKSYK
ncbi:hypothetical protein QUF50_10045, partial [Thiotrichales bacterium HSG1]|nr:hypothetical protein [Thiotrichales bacterium HSG1]